MAESCKSQCNKNKTDNQKEIRATEKIVQQQPSQSNVGMRPWNARTSAYEGKWHLHRGRCACYRRDGGDTTTYYVPAPRGPFRLSSNKIYSKTSCMFNASYMCIIRYDVGGYHSRLSRGIPGFESPYRKVTTCGTYYDFMAERSKALC